MYTLFLCFTNFSLLYPCKIDDIIYCSIIDRKRVCMKKKYYILITMFLVILVGFVYSISKNETHLNSEKYTQSTIPTLFFHGYGSSARAEKHMTEAARKAGVTKTIIQATVNRNGQVDLIGKIPKNAINPIIKVQYEDNRNPDYQQDAEYAKKVVTKLQQMYGFQKMNMVGHSMGNMSILFYLLEYGKDDTLPQIQKQVHIANHVNGIEGMDMPDGMTIMNLETGQPNKMSQSYTKLLSLREIFPQNQVDVLNIYGDYKNQSDGSVLNSSSKALKYLLFENAKSYQEKQFTGKLAKHSLLHENPEVDKALINFLWAK